LNIFEPNPKEINRSPFLQRTAIFIKKRRIMRIGKFLAVALLNLALGTVYAQTKQK